MPLDLLQADRVDSLGGVSPLINSSSAGSGIDWSSLSSPHGSVDFGVSSGSVPVHANPDSALNASDLLSTEIPEVKPDISDDPIFNVDTAKSDAVDNYSAGASLAEMMKNHPGLSYLEYMQEMAKYSDEWAEKLLDYYAEKESINEQNAYTASREDTAYQRLVEDLKKAGLNPAMMYGSSASPSASGSVGHLNMSEGSTYRGLSGNYKMKQLLLAMVAMQWQITHEQTNDIFKGIDTIGKFLIPLLGSLL